MAKSYHLKLKGYVGGYDFDTDYVDYTLDKHKDEDVSVLIDSLGGAVNTGFSISSAFHSHGRVSVHFRGMNASAATVASLGARHISMDSSAMYLAHKCSSPVMEWAMMNADQLRSKAEELIKTAENLDKIDVNIATMYATRCKKEPQQLLALMKEGGWLTAKEALDWGFVDEITDDEDATRPSLDKKTAAALNAAGIPLPNVPMDDEPLLNRLLSLFHRNENNSKTIFKMKFENIGQLTQTADFDVKDDKVCLSTQQMQGIEDKLRNNTAEIAALSARVEELSKKPAVETQAVSPSNGTETNAEKSEIENYINTYNSARKLFEEVG